ncbi:hypothetical protein BAUCODRAFT_151623 [Baudoinia panamericana UAMH 10762]|uniref:SAC domain-containing protein n=1 Tax=Baudoinia panamericana (strain UAMH 10762) TaxID=717646 RepID=M2MLD2_BAUPA|nr:uncharacterized protein BAUCODRAFT_151623 [Baudoinia panamericana UAMH 10762]EMC92193.1 hypothetical protein BAUCODRAFT_151623 [Baudoinia panamericana UAMH 10762]
MPGLVRKLLICAAVDGLFLHPVGAQDQGTKSVCIAYGSNAISSASRTDDNDAHDRSIEAHGIVGLLDLVSSSYLISITRREQVAQIRGKPVYSLTDVTLIPLASQAEAEKAILKVQKTLKTGHAVGEETDESDVGEASETASIDEADPGELTPEVAALEAPKAGVVQKGTNIVKSVVQDRGKYGRFASRWFSKGGRSTGLRSQQGLDDGLTREQEEQTAEALPQTDSDAQAGAKQADPRSNEADDGEAKQTAQALPGTVTNANAGAEASHSDPAVEHEGNAKSGSGKPAPKQRSTVESLMPRILRSAKLYFSSSGFFFSYEHDLSGTLMQKDVVTSSLPLHTRFGSLFFWNRHLVEPFISAGHDSFVLPLMQGFVGQRAFSISRTDGTDPDVVAEAAQKPEEVIAAQGQPTPTDTGARNNQEDYILTLISRRSVKRAGLRYLRRGVDNEGNVANSVETEQILSPQSWHMSAKTFSLVQVRGSIPLFFSQSPYSFKPLPILFGSESTNQAALQKHFGNLKQRYGDVQVASLVDKHATEAGIGEAFERQVGVLNEHGGVEGKAVGFEWFDFHAQCKGMKFENVSLLLDTLQSPLKSFGWIVKQNDRNVRQQKGVLRTNCMDCLDRTNVVQSAVGGWALQQQLAELGLNIDLQKDPKTQWFNTLWADNGDAISKQYAGTSALKGDFTRTRKRNWTGALSDFSLTLNRYYNNIFGDYFLQLNIDFYLGNVGPSAFDDFEADMMSQDYALDVKRIRQNAIDTCIKIVLEDPKEHLTAGWSLSCPQEANTLKSLPFEECVLLLTDAALYFCRFDWDAEKVGSFERVDLTDITQLWCGAYITSTLGPTHTDQSKNYGFALRYQTRGQAVVRTNTRTLDNEKAAEEENKGKNELQKQSEPEKNESRLLAFKALPPTSSAVKHPGREEAAEGALSEPEFIRSICEDIQRLLAAALRKTRGTDHLELEKVPQVEDRDVISVSDARKSTGYIESLGYSLKKLVWS